VRRGVSGLIAVLVLGLVMVSLISTAVTLSSRLQRGVEESSSRASRILSEASQPPALSLYSSNGALYVEIVASRPLEIRGFIVELPNSVSFKPAGNVTMGVSRFKVVEGYNCEPARVHVLLASGLVTSYDPRLDPRVGFTPKGWDGWWRCSLAQDAGGGGWWIVDPLRMQPVKALGGGGNDTVEYDIYVTTSFTGSTVIVDRVYRQAVPALGGYVTVSLRGELVPVNVKESLLVLRVTGPSNSTFFTGDVTIYLRAKARVSPPQGYSCDVVRIEIFPVVYTPNGVVTKILERVYNFWWQCYYEYEMRYRVSLVDSNVVAMTYTYTAEYHSDANIVVQDARYEVNVTLVKAKVVDVKPVVYSLGSPGWVRLLLSGYGVAHDPLGIRLRWIAGIEGLTFTTVKRYSIPPWVGFIWPGTVSVTGTEFNPYTTQYDINYGGHPQVTVVLDAGGGLSKNFTLTSGRPITLAYPGEVKIVVTPRPEPPFNDPYAHERTDPAPIFAPWRAPAIITAEYVDGRREIIVVSPTGHVTIGQGNLVFTGYGQLLGGLPFTFTPSNSRLAETPVDMNSLTVGKSSWLPQPAISTTNTYRIVAVIPGDRLKAGYVITWIN
jgi:hypothetical protein